MADANAFLIYQDDNGVSNVNVRFEGEDVWLAAEQLQQLFQASRQDVAYHIQQIYSDGELMKEATCKKVDGYTWSFRVNNGEAEIVADEKLRCAVSPSPTGRVAIPSTLSGLPVTCIGGEAFFGCGGLKEVEIPSRVISIGIQAFTGCSALTSMTMPEGVTNISMLAFQGCNGLTSVTVLGECPTAPNDIFQHCGKLKSIHVPANAKSWAGMKEWQGITLVFDAK